MDYLQFLESKKQVAISSGFEKPKESMNPNLFDWQKDIVFWALKKGRAALFEDCGLGKTIQQLEWAQSVSDYCNKPVLILAPLAVSEQTKREGQKFGYVVNVAQSGSDIVNGINITNYEKIEKFDTSVFCGVVLDESSILKAYTGITKRKIINAFTETKYKLSCSATPAPNDLMELLNQAEFLGIMKSSEALACWFIADQSNSGHYRLKGHAESDFWRWVSGWAVCIEKPSDIGYSDDGYILPEMKEIDVYCDLMDDPFREIGEIISMNATSYHAEKRKTIDARTKLCADIVNNSKEQFVVWCYQNEEADRLKKLIPESVEIRGSDKTEKKEDAAVSFVNGDIRVLISKPSIFGYGLNFQQCRNMVFCGLDYSFESYYQAVRRVYRFGQLNQVNVWRVMGENEKVILDTISRKAKIKQDMNASVSDSVRDFQINEITGSRFKLDLSTHKTDFPSWIRSEQ